ncbi:TetR family transcriptional regulator (plasmid) [Streptomyces sp. BI20]|uniref:TetR family transcriptional regulator n=1 Tax=Streptomyces sp. BI20 TaxID=3403460 RepID=UPI003C778723
MARQPRAVRTRALLIHCAATEFDRAGYEAATLSAVNALAEVSMGAMTFHFRNKAALADAVQSRGGDLVRDAVAEVLARPRPALAAGVALTVALTRLLEENVEVRAAARLARERSPSTWGADWLPALGDLFRRAGDEYGLRPGSDPAVLARLAGHLVTGMEMQLREARTRPPAAPDEDPGTEPGPVPQLAEIWRLVLRGVTDKDPDEYEQDLT